MASAVLVLSYRVAGGFAGVGAAGGQGPGEPSGLSGSFDAPSVGLLVAMVVPAAGVAITGTRPSPRPGDGVLVVAAVLWCPAGAEGAVLVQHGGQVFQMLAGVVSGCFVLVVAGAGEGLEVEVEVAFTDGELPGPVSAARIGLAGRDEGRVHPVLRGGVARRARSSSCSGLPGGVAAGGLPAGVPDRSAVRAGHRHADGTSLVFGDFAREVAGEVSVDGTELVQVPGPGAGLEPGTGGEGQVQPAGHPVVPGPAGLGPAGLGSGGRGSGGAAARAVSVVV